MAISATHYRLLKSLPLPRGGSLLEIGEANWYGDVAPDFPCEETSNLFAVAKACYASIFAPSRIVSVDAGGTPAALRLDLNEQFRLGEKFDVVINHGTAEHIFNIGQVFRTAHDHSADWMIHESPFTGWIDHGFYCLQPTLFYDLAAANCYEVVTVAIEDLTAGAFTLVQSREHVYVLAEAGTIPANTMLFVAFRKRFDGPFTIPQQGYYAGKLGAVGNRAWEQLR